MISVCKGKEEEEEEDDDDKEAGDEVLEQAVVCRAVRAVVRRSALHRRAKSYIAMAEFASW